MQRAVDGVDAVVHLGAVPNEAPFEDIAGPNLHGVFHVFEACRRSSVKRIVFASSNHASGMYPVGEPLDGSQRARPDGLYGASKAYGEALGSMYVDRFGLSIVCLRIGSFQPHAAREARAVDLDQPRRRDPAGAGRADRRRRRLRDRLRRVGQHAPLVAAGRRGRLRARRTTPRCSPPSSTARTTRTRAARTRRFEHGGWAT